jgi:N-acetylglucosaminyl-diphospho-decaprenol L-rhamnosyltransferase
VTIDVVIPTWRGRDLLESCLEHVRAQNVRAQTIVVDNASGDGTVEMVAERFPDVRLIELPANLGFGAAVNRGVRAGEGEAVVLVNNDVELEPGALEALVAPLADERVGMVAGLTTMPGTGLVDTFGIQLDATLAAYGRQRGRPVGEAGGRLAGPMGGLAAYRRTAFEQAGGFDERLFAYGEDVDLALRLRAAGWLTTEAPAAHGVHLGGATTGVGSAFQRELAGFSRGYLLRRYGVLRSRAAVRALVFEALVVGWGIARHRTLVPLRTRVRGWRAGAGERRPIPADAVDPEVGWREALRRLLNA